MRTAIVQTGGLASRFLTWWLGELGALVPGVLHRAITGGRGVLCFEVVGDELVVNRASNGKPEEVARLDLRQPDNILRAAVAGVLRDHASGRTDVVLVLGAEQVLHKLLDLPLAAEEGLRDLLYFELDRQTPYRPEQVHYDFRVTERDPAARRMKVDLLVAPIESVERLTAQAAKWGLQPSTVTAANVDDLANPVFDLSGGTRLAPSRGGWLGLVILALLAVGMFTAAVWLPLEAQRQAALEADAVLADARKTAIAAADLRDELDRRTKAGNFLVRRKSEAAMMTAVLADLTRLLPDDTWLFVLHVRGTVVRARGYTPAASAVLELVERGPAFRNARFTSPVTRVPGIDAERFDLTFEFAGASEKDS